MTANAFAADGDLSPSRRAADLFREAKTLADANTLDFVARLEELIQRAAQIAEGGEVYAPGVRDLCRTFSDLGARRADAINAVLRERPAAPAQHALERRRNDTYTPARLAAEPSLILTPNARLAPTPAILSQLARFAR